MSRFETGMAVSVWAGLFFAIDALFSVVKLFLRRRPVFHGLSALVILVMIPLPYYLHAKATAMAVVLALLVAPEALSILLHVRDKKREAAIADTP